MNTTALSRHYECLTPWERVPLMVAASLRGDPLEADRLAQRAPTSTFRVPNYRGLSEGLHQLVFLYLVEQLEFAALYHQTLAVTTDLDNWAQGKTLAKREKQMSQLLRLLAFRFVLQADAWKILGDKLHIEPEALLRGLPGVGVVQRMEACARATAFTAEEALAYLTAEYESERTGQDVSARKYVISTAAEVVQAWMAWLQERVAWWA